MGTCGRIGTSEAADLSAGCHEVSVPASGVAKAASASCSMLLAAHEAKLEGAERFCRLPAAGREAGAARQTRGGPLEQRA
jgi:hypothetical protein